MSSSVRSDCFFMIRTQWHENIRQVKQARRPTSVGPTCSTPCRFPVRGWWGALLVLQDLLELGHRDEGELVVPRGAVAEAVHREGPADLGGTAFFDEYVVVGLLQTPPGVLGRFVSWNGCFESVLRDV